MVPLHLIKKDEFMSQLQFQAKIGLRQAVPAGDGTYTVQIEFRDAEGVFRGQDILPGDVLVFDTGVIEPGTYTRYDITEVSNVGWTGEIDLIVRYREDNTNVWPNPELEYLVGEEGTVSRPSPILGLLPVVSPQAQEIKDAFSFYVLNHNLVKILDHPRPDGGSGSSDAQPVQLITAQWLPVFPEGRAPLPSPPLGDFVWDMGFAYLMDGSMVEIMGVKPEFDDTQEQWYARIPAEDMVELGGMVGAITVSYLVATSS